jgi:retinol-binding protein 3
MKWIRLMVVLASSAGAWGCGAAVITEPPQSVIPPVPVSTSGTTMQSGGDRKPQGPDGPITAALRDQTIDGLLKALADKYVFPEKAAEVKKAISARKARREYDSITTGHALATALTDHINLVLKDAHFNVRFSLENLPERAQAEKPSAEEIQRAEVFERIINGGFEKVERLPGNIGYIEVRSFAFPKRGYEAAAAAMGFVAETDALIIDIRRNGGGDPDAVAALSSYFFPEPVHLNDIYFRPANETRQFWTMPGVSGKRYLDREIYVLTSKKTGSAAEEFAYNLKQLKRATILGEVTWGGANPGDVMRLNDHFSAFVPNGRAINPITKTNWEGVGVKPDIEAPADDALRVAQVKLLEKRIAATKDPELKRNFEERLRELEKK